MLILPVQILNHLIFSTDVFLHSVDILWSLSVILLLQIIDRLWLSFRSRQYVLYGVGHYEIFIRFQSLHRLLVDARNSVLFMLAIVREISDWRQLVVAHGSSPLL